MKLPFMIITILICFLSVLLASIVPSSPAVDESNDIEKEYLDLCKDSEITLQLSNEQSITSNFISSPTLKCLSIEYSNVRSVSEAAFNKLPNLQYLSLRGNQIPPSDFFSFGHLRNVSNQTIDSWYNGQSVEMRGIYPQLVHLDLSYNNIKNIQFHMFTNSFANLIHLDLSGNSIQFFDNTLVHFPRLMHLYLENNKIVTLHLQQENNLTLLALDNNKIQRINNDCYDSLCLTGLYHLKNLTLSYNQISHIESTAFRDTVHLQHLNLSMNSLYSIAAETFDYLSSLRVLVLDGNKFSEIPKVGSKLLNLRTLSINCNPITSLPKDAFNMYNLTTLFLSGNLIKEISASTFAKQNKLEELYLNDNELSYLPENFYTNMYNLRYLHLEGNKFASLQSISLANTSPSLKVYLSSDTLRYVNAALLQALPKDVTVYLNADYSCGNRNISTCRSNKNLQV